MTTTEHPSNYVAVTPKGAGGKGSGGGQPQEDPHARATRTRLRDRILTTKDGVVARATDRRVAAYTPKEAAASEDVRGRSLWQDGPSSPAAMLDYTRSGAWAPGDQHPAVEFLGRAFGYTSFLLTLALSVLLWVTQRPSRLLLASLVGFLLWWTFGGTAPADVPADGAGVKAS